MCEFQNMLASPLVVLCSFSTVNTRTSNMNISVFCCSMPRKTMDFCMHHYETCKQAEMENHELRTRPGATSVSDQFNPSR